MAAKSGAPTPAAPQEFDKVISDMAEYIHQYEIDSDLAVRMKRLYGIEWMLI